MKPTAEQEALWQSVATMAVYGRDAVRTMHLLETDEVPEADDRGRRRVEGYKIAWEGRVLEGKSDLGVVVSRMGYKYEEMYGPRGHQAVGGEW